MSMSKRQVWWGEPQSLLKEEIIDIQKELEGQTIERSVLQKALNLHLALSDDPTYKSLAWVSFFNFFPKFYLTIYGEYKLIYPCPAAYRGSYHRNCSSGNGSCVFREVPSITIQKELCKKAIYT